LNKNIFILLVVFLSIFKINACKHLVNTEEFFNEKNSSVFSIRNDSLFKRKFNKVLEFKKDENYVSALNKALELLDTSKTNEDHYYTYKSLHLIASIYNKTNKFRASLKYYRKALTIIKSSKIEESNSRFSKIDFTETLLKVGTSYHYLSISLEENNRLNYLDSAKVYYEKIEQLPILNNISENFKAIAFSNLSGIYEQDSIYDKAEIYVQKAIKINKNNKNNLQIAKSINNLGNIYLSQRKFKESKDIYLEALDHIKNNNNPDVISTKADLYFNLAWAMRNLKDYKAYDFQELSYSLLDTIREKDFRGRIEEINARYNVDVAKRKVRLEEENKRLKDQQTFWIIGILGIIVIISLGYWLNLNKLKRKNLALKLSQSELLQNQEIEKVKSDSQVRILNATIDGKESERKEIAEILHDSVSALLSSANMHLQATTKQFNGSTPIEIDKTQKIITEASHKVRDLSHNLVSSLLLKFGLSFAIRDIAETFSNSILTIDTEINDIRRYSQNFEIKVYNMIKEFLNNIIKHSEAGYALVELKEENKTLFIKISDDGIGFDKTKINMKDGLGINQIEARVQVMKGKFDIESSKNNGTKVTLEIPILEKEEVNHVLPVQ
jgi:signal transduction histidine kinase